MLNNSALSNEQIRRYAPSVFASQASTRQSSRYAFIPTSAIVAAMQGSGWNVVKASESRTRQEDRKGFVKHMLRFAPNSAMQIVGDSRVEVVLVNSHDGSSQYSLSAGVFRVICSNGMVVADSLLESIKVRHTGNIIDMVLEGSERILQNAPLIQNTIDTWKALPLTTSDQYALAKAAHVLRFPEGSAISADQLLKPRRSNDNGSDLWSTFNRLQESTIRGGNVAYDPNANEGRGRRVRAREVKNISGNVNLNKALWTLADEMAKAKQAA